jgi:H+/gluconate symporter-like permease
MKRSKSNTWKNWKKRSNGKRGPKEMDQGLKMVIGMSLAYITSFAGLVLAYFSYRAHQKKKKQEEEQGKGQEHE